MFRRNRRAKWHQRNRAGFTLSSGFATDGRAPKWINASHVIGECNEPPSSSTRLRFNKKLCSSIIPLFAGIFRWIWQFSHVQNQFPYEYSGIYFHAFQPQFVRTPMTDGRLNIASKFIYPDVEQWVPQALKSVMANNDGHSAGCLSHEFLVWCQVNLSESSKSLHFL